MDTLQQVCEDARWWCENGNLGYDQGQRYTWEQSGYKTGTEVDCSSFIIGLLKKHGYATGGATYTGNMSSELCKYGWTRVANDGNPRLGDILLNDAHHVALYIGNGRIAQASRGEYGHRISGGQAGDQDGYETNTRNYYNYPWNCYLRYAAAPQASDIAVANPQRIAVDGYWGNGTTLAWQKIFGTVQDGIVSSQWVGNKGILKGCTQGFEWVSDPKGSPLVRKIQAMLGVPQDGIIGPVTVRALEKRYGYAQDGVLDCPSLTIKAFQADANRRL